MLSRLEGRAHRGGAFAEEGGRLGRDVHRRNRPGHLPTDSQRLAAGGQHADLGALGEHERGQSGGRPHQVLAIVEHQQEALGPQLGGQRVFAGPARLLPDAKAVHHRRHQQPGVGERRQLHQPDAVREVVDQLRGGLQGQPRLAGASRTGQA